jgi:hypothetical protein
MNEFVFEIAGSTSNEDLDGSDLEEQILQAIENAIKGISIGGQNLTIETFRIPRPPRGGGDVSVVIRIEVDQS